MVLKLKQHNEAKEIAFELKYLRSLSTAQRFRMMLEKSRQLKMLLFKKNGDRKVTTIIKRS
jgi:hypothetical protein